MKRYLQKQLKYRDKKLKYDFLPSMIEIIERPANRLGTVILYLVIALFVSALIWANVTKLDIAVTASGATKPENAIVTLNAQSTSTIEEVFVQDGQQVQEGDIICTLDVQTNETSLEQNQYNLEILGIQKDVYEVLYEKLQAEDYTEVEMDITPYGENQRFAQAILLEYQIFLDGMNRMGYTERETAKANEQLKVVQTLNETEEKIKSVEANIKAIQQELEKCEIKATVTGTYSRGNDLYKGKMVAAGDVLGYIMPDEAADVFTAYVMDEDIGQIKIGNKVKIRIAAFADTEYEYVQGEIASIGNVAMQVDNMGNVYLVEIKLEQVPSEIKAGMEGNVDMIVGTRSVMDYFMEPFRKGLRNSLKER